MDLRSTKEIIKDIKSLVNTTGYIYALCLILIEDFHYNAEEMHQIDNRSRLNKNEISFLIGFLIQEEISITKPKSPFNIIRLKKATKELMEELHRSTMIPSIEKFKPLIENLESQIESHPSKKDFFAGENMFIEPIFYAGDGVYDFQYLEYLEKKYKYDKVWLNKNANFYFDQAKEITNRIKAIHQEKFKKVNFLSLQENKEKIIKKFKKSKLISNKQLKENYDEFLAVLEFYQFYELFGHEPDLAEKLSKKEVSENSWNNFYEGLLDLFCIKKDDFKENLKISHFLENFAITKKTNNRNKQFKEIGDFNLFTAKPIIQLDSKNYFVPICFSVFEAVYESPYYWILEDKKYKDKLAKNRGKVGEEITYEILKSVFGEARVFKSIRIESKKGYDDSDIDVLCILGSKALCVQVKSKKLTQISRQGDYKQLQKDFKGAVQDAYNQGLTCRDRILEKKAKFFDENNNEIKFSEAIEEVYILVITTENYPSLTHQSFTLLEKEEDKPYPLVSTIFDLELICHYLENPYDFLYYIRQRIDLMEYFTSDEEMHFLGYHLLNKLWKNPKYHHVMLASDYGQLIDRNYYPLKIGIKTSSQTDKIKHRWKNDDFDILCNEIDSLNTPKSTDVIFHLLDLSAESRENLINQIKFAKNKTSQDGRQHNFSIIPGFIRSAFGLTFISWNSNDKSSLLNRLLIQSRGRKYKSKANFWVGFGCLKDSGRMVDTLVFSDSKWEYDEELEKESKILFGGKNNGTPVKLGRKIGRNEYCPCGSGIKYRKCCGRLY